ncbi:ferritin-like domain-containing protein [Clostridium paraputrificum]|uniref:ferritin-like domain-containing protein n=1 Tax=Clostridium TaxID=1485 RepID=UPI003D342387
MRHSDDNIYSLNLPYPPIIVEKKNPKYIPLLLQNYSGMVSEFTAVSQYVYHKFRLFGNNRKVADTISGIAMVEMHHLAILGELITQLGGDPKYWINRKNKMYYWDGKFVDYGSNLKEFLTYDIQAEVAAIRQYKETIVKISDKNIVNILERIILDEELHLRLFKELYQEFVNE